VFYLGRSTDRMSPFLRQQGRSPRHVPGYVLSRIPAPVSELRCCMPRVSRSTPWRHSPVAVIAGSYHRANAIQKTGSVQTGQWGFPRLKGSEVWEERNSRVPGGGRGGEGGHRCPPKLPEEVRRLDDTWSANKGQTQARVALIRRIEEPLIEQTSMRREVSDEPDRSDCSRWAVSGLRIPASSRRPNS
jgi:hypothetical protein